MSSATSLARSFESPTADYRACPFWFWNGELEPGELIRQVRLMDEAGIGGFVIHARVGLGVAYLSDDWFDRCALVIEEAERRRMKVWIYDEDNWPSGYAGGRVLARDPSFIGQNLMVERHLVRAPERLNVKLDRPAEVRGAVAVRIAKVEPIPPHPLTLHRPADDAAPWTDLTRFTHTYATEEPPLPLNVTGDALDWTPPPGDWCVMVMRQRPTDWIAAYSSCPYADLMNDGATTAFIEETHAQYHRRFERHFGQTILGFFVDEPGFYNNFWDRNPASVPWTHDFAPQFLSRRGYDLMPWAAALWEDLGNRGRQVRMDFWRTVGELLEERFFRKIADWCAQHNVMLTGHLEWEEWLLTMVRHSASPFTSLRSLQVPAVDKIDQVTEKITEKLVSSIAHANDRPRVLSETFALIGWKLAPPYMRQIVDRQYVRGVNWLSCHGFYYSTEDWRKRECPPSEFFQNPWWPHSRPLWDYVGRLSAALSAGRHAAPVALYYPTEHAWAALSAGAPKAFNGMEWEAWQMSQIDHPVQKTDLSLNRLNETLLSSQYDFDYIDHTLLADAAVEAGQLRVNREHFGAVVVPAIQTIGAAALSRLLALAEAGGTVIFVNQLPTNIVDGDRPAHWDTLASELGNLRHPGVVATGAGRLGFVPHGDEGVVVLLRRWVTPDLRVLPTAEARQFITTQHSRFVGYVETRIAPLHRALRYHRRVLDDGQNVYFVVNESGERFEAVIELAGGNAVERWYPDSGQRRPVASTEAGAGRTRLTMMVEPWDSYLFIVAEGRPLVPKPSTPVWARELDDWQLQIDGQSLSGGLASWHELGFGHFSGVATYATEFDLSAGAAACERIVLDLGQVLETAVVTINGNALPPLAFGPYRVDLTPHVRSGANRLSIEVANSNTNAWELVERASGMLGPVKLTCQKRS